MNTGLAIWSMIPSKTERMARRTMLESSDMAMQMKFDAPPTSSKQRAWSIRERQSMSGAAGAPPVTPRTMAFNRLGGGGYSDQKAPRFA